MAAHCRIPTLKLDPPSEGTEFAHALGDGVRCRRVLTDWPSTECAAAGRERDPVLLNEISQKDSSGRGAWAVPTARMSGVPDSAERAGPEPRSDPGVRWRAG